MTIGDMTGRLDRLEKIRQGFIKDTEAVVANLGAMNAAEAREYSEKLGMAAGAICRVQEVLIVARTRAMKWAGEAMGKARQPNS